MKTVNVAAAVIRDGSRIFATQRGYGDYKDGWEFPGGKIEPGETPRQALVREIREELDTEIQVGDCLATVEYDYPLFHLSMQCFWCTITEGTPVLKEHEAARWLDVKSLDQVDWLPADRTILERIQSELRRLDVLPQTPREAHSPACCSVLDAIEHRHSYRGRYKAVPVPREDLVRILQAGLAAPSGCNRQTTSLIAIDDPEVLSALLRAIDPPVAETAPAAICVLTRRIPAYRDKCFAVQDYAAAIENMLLAITALGYQSCWFEGHITDDDRICDRMAQILHVPEDYELVCFLPVGIGEDVPAPPKKKAFSERAWFNSFPQN